MQCENVVLTSKLKSIETRFNFIYTNYNDVLLFYYYYSTANTLCIQPLTIALKKVGFNSKAASASLSESW